MKKKKSDFEPLISEGGNEFIEQCFAAADEIEPESALDLYIDTIYDRLNKMNPLFLMQMIVNHATEGQLNIDHSENILKITSLLAAADEELNKGLRQARSELACKPGFFDEWIQQKSSELSIFNEEQSSFEEENSYEPQDDFQDDEDQEELQVVLDTEQITEQARKQILQELEEEGISMDDPDIGSVLVEKTMDSLAGIKAMMDMRSALYMMREEQDCTELTCLSLLLSSSGILAENILKSKADAAELDYEKLAENMAEECDANQSADRMNEAYRFLKSHLQDPQMRS